MEPNSARRKLRSTLELALEEVSTCSRPTILRQTEHSNTQTTECQHNEGTSSQVLLLRNRIPAEIKQARATANVAILARVCTQWMLIVRGVSLISMVSACGLSSVGIERANSAWASAVERSKARLSRSSAIQIRAVVPSAARRASGGQQDSKREDWQLFPSE